MASCPCCGADLGGQVRWDEAEKPQEALPKRGDITTCVDCSMVLAYEDPDTLRLLEPRDVHRLTDEAKTQLIEMIGFVELYRLRKAEMN